MKTTDTKSRILELMTIYNMNQTDFCNKTGITKSALSNYLNADRIPRQDAIAKIADAFNISASWLMGYDTPMEPIKNANTMQKVESDEELLIVEYRQLDTWGKSAVLETASRELNRCKGQNDLVEKRRKLLLLDEITTKEDAMLFYSTDAVAFNGGMGATDEELIRNANSALQELKKSNK